MANTVITSKTLVEYLRMLQKNWKNSMNFRLLTNASIIDFLDDSLFSVLRQEFFNDDNANIFEVCYQLYESYRTEKRRATTTFVYGKRILGDYNKASIIKTILRIIKYNLVILDEKKNNESVFFQNDPLELMTIDEDIVPANWIFISEEQLKSKIELMNRFGMADIVCPITNYRVKGYELKNDNPSIPLVVLKEDAYKRTVYKFINTFVFQRDSNGSMLYRPGTSLRSNCFYFGAFEPKFARTSSESFEFFQDMARRNLYINNENYEVFYILNYEATHANDLFVRNDIFVFERIKSIGYVLQAVIRAKVEREVSHNIFFTSNMSKDALIHIVDACDTVYSCRFQNCNLKNFFNTKPSAEEPQDLKEYRITHCLMENLPLSTPQTPNYIIYP